jgi:hypothetical protein
VNSIIKKAKALIKNEQRLDAVKYVEEYVLFLPVDKLSEKDFAFINAFLGQLFLTLEPHEVKSYPGVYMTQRNIEAIAFLSTSIAKSALSPQKHHLTLLKLSDLYFTNGNYREAYRQQLLFLQYANSTFSLYDQDVLVHHLSLFD